LELQHPMAVIEHTGPHVCDGCVLITILVEMFSGEFSMVHRSILPLPPNLGH